MTVLVISGVSEMKITILMGSPNKNGSTSLLVNEYVRGAKEAGHTCEAIDVCHEG